MQSIRIIPRLDIKGPNLVKGIHLEGLRVLGIPEDFATYYYDSGADELMFMDVVASLYERNSLTEIITKTARGIFIPLTVGGGLRSIDDINCVLRAGADKVSLNTAAIRDPQLVERASRQFGSSTIVISIEAIRQQNGSYLAYTDNAREHTGVDAIEWARKVEKLGAGEILATSVDREGTGKGFDTEFIRILADQVSIPVIAHGGAGSIQDVVDVINEGHADAVAIASILHYERIRNNSKDSEDAASEGNFEFLKSGRGVPRLQTTEINALKSALRSHNVPCRV
jgi:cyclase